MMLFSAKGNLKIWPLTRISCDLFMSLFFFVKNSYIKSVNKTKRFETEPCTFHNFRKVWSSRNKRFIEEKMSRDKAFYGKSI